jgi:lysophospholipase L1-like esterase
MRDTRLVVMAGILLASGVGRAQLVEEFNAPPANCCLAASAKSLADQLQDWNQIGRYYRANQELKKRAAEPGRVVFIGDSITDGWRLDEYFAGKPYVNRGIGGQTTAQMLVRVYPDVIDLKPAAMVVLAGTNDIARNTGPATAEMIQHNIMAMTELAQHHKIKVLLCSILPISDYPFLAQQSAGAPPPPPPGRGPGRGAFPRQRMTVGRPPADILKLNAWLKDYAQRVGAIYVDYFSALVDEKGWLKDGLANDGLHPNADGYKIMAPIVQTAIERALR